jgi:pyruvate,water dikinase
MARRVSFIERGLAQARLSIGHRPSMSRGIVGIQELDIQDMDSNMGCPLSTYEEATLGLVGGKALQCWRLMKYGLPVPPSFIIPTYVYSVHVGNAGVEEVIEEIFSSDLRDEAVREAAKEKLARVNKAIRDTPLPDEVIENIEMFVDAMPGNNTYAVRSSGSAEDLASQSFAGQYDTFLYKGSVDEICESVKGCWASMFKSHILDYVATAAAQDKSEAYSPENMRPPKMGVLIMKMVDAQAAGVCFTRNLWGEIDEAMIEAVPGQGEGLVGGEITPDRFVLNKYTGKTIYKTIETQTHKFVRANNVEGVEKIELDAPMEKSVLTPANLKVRNCFSNLDLFFSKCSREAFQFLLCC